MMDREGPQAAAGGPEVTRQAYTLTRVQFAALGATEPAPGYVPGELRPIQNRPARGPHYHGTHGTVPAVQPDSAIIWQDIAEHHKVKMLSIRWPDAAYPEFTAEPL